MDVVSTQGNSNIIWTGVWGVAKVRERANGREQLVQGCACNNQSSPVFIIITIMHSDRFHNELVWFTLCITPVLLFLAFLLPAGKEPEKIGTLKTQWAAPLCMQLERDSPSGQSHPPAPVPPWTTSLLIYIGEESKQIKCLRTALQRDGRSVASGRASWRAIQVSWRFGLYICSLSYG